MAQAVRNGTVLDRINQQPIGRATLQNKQSARATLSNDEGRFQMAVSAGDTLLVSCVGFETLRFVVPAESPELLIQLSPKVTTLSEVVVKGWTEARFKEEFLKLAPPEKQKIEVGVPADLQGVMLGNVGRTGYDATNLAPKVTVGGPASFLYDKFSRQSKLNQKLREGQLADSRQKQYKARMDPVWIARITELNGERLDAFMKFCHPPESLVLEAKEYDLIVAIQDCLKEFLAQEKTDKG